MRPCSHRHLRIGPGLVVTVALAAVSACGGEMDDAASPSTIVDDPWQGTWRLTMATDTTAVDFTVELVTAEDGAVYGFMESEEAEYRAPIGLSGPGSDPVAEADSLRFATYTHDLVVAVPEMSASGAPLMADDVVLQGTFDFFDEAHPARLERVASTVRASLIDTRDLLPLKLDIDAPSAAWAAPLDGSTTYLVANGVIHLAEEAGDVWRTTRVRYDTTAWDFYSIGLSPQGDRLVAHGRPLRDTLPTFGGGDYYVLHLASRTEVERVEHLPPSVNTDSFEIFPAFTPGGDLLVTSFGALPGVEPRGRADLYLARARGEGRYDVAPLDPELNTPASEAGASMDPQGRYLVFHRNDPSRGVRDRLAVSRRTADGWSEPEELGPPVTRDFTWTYGGRVDPGGDYLFFNSGFRGRSEIFRIPLAEIPELARYD